MSRSGRPGGVGRFGVFEEELRWGFAQVDDPSSLKIIQEQRVGFTDVYCYFQSLLMLSLSSLPMCMFSFEQIYCRFEFLVNFNEFYCSWMHRFILLHT